MGSLTFLINLNFNHFYDSHQNIVSGIHHINLVKILDIKYRRRKNSEKVTVKLELEYSHSQDPVPCQLTN